MSLRKSSAASLFDATEDSVLSSSSCLVSLDDFCCLRLVRVMARVGFRDAPFGVADFEEKRAATASVVSSTKMRHEISGSKTNREELN